MIQTPWKAGHRPVIRLHARENKQQALTRIPHTQQPAGQIALSAERQLSEAQIAEMFFSEDPRQRLLALNALNDRMQYFGDVLTGERTIRLSQTDNFPDARNAGVPEAVMLSDTNRQAVDLRWLSLYNVQNRRSEPYPGYFKISDLYHAVTVDEYEPGERIKFGYVEKGEEIFSHNIYGTGLQWNMLEMQGRWDRQQGIAAMQTKWANKLASLAYAGITASGMSTTSYVDQDGSSGVSLVNDQATINAAIREMMTAYFNATPADTEEQGTGTQAIEEEFGDSPFYLLYNNLTTRYEDRVMDALQATFVVALGGGNATLNEVRFNVIPIGSPRIATGNWFLVRPGRKLVFSVLRDLRFYDFMDPRIAGVGEGEVGWGLHRFVRGDVRQVRKLALS